MKLSLLSKVVLILLLLKFTILSAQKKTMPVFFISSATPQTILGVNNHTDKIKSILSDIPEKPKSILFVSSLWSTSGIYVTASIEPTLMYDFKGVPDEFYHIKYPLKGDPNLAQEIANSIKLPPCQAELDRGIDHGAWAIAKLLYPEGDVPIVEISVNQYMPAISHWSLGEKLRSLREKGVLIICTGTVVNNPKMMKYNVAPYVWATNFQTFVQTEIEKKNINKLLEYRKLGKGSGMSVPVTTNLMPLFTAIGLKNKNENITIINDGIENASVSLLSFMIK